MKKTELEPFELEIRAKLMVKADELGLSADQISLIFGKKITRARVYQIINNYRVKQNN